MVSFLVLNSLSPDPMLTTTQKWTLGIIAGLAVASSSRQPSARLENSSGRFSEDFTPFLNFYPDTIYHIYISQNLRARIPPFASLFLELEFISLLLTLASSVFFNPWFNLCLDRVRVNAPLNLTLDSSPSLWSPLESTPPGEGNYMNRMSRAWSDVVPMYLGLPYTSRSRCHPSLDAMPTPEMFKEFSSKSSAPEGSSATVVPANDKAEDVPQPTIVTSDDILPAYPDSLNYFPAHAIIRVCLPFDADPRRKEDVQAALTPSPEQQTPLDTLVAPAKALMDTSQISEAIHKGVNTFMEAVPPLMKALDEFVKIHPPPHLWREPIFSNQRGTPDDDLSHRVVVLAPEGAYILEKKRIENDKRVLALNAECVVLNF